MNTKHMIKAGLLASALLGLTAPAIAQRDGGRDDARGQGQNGGGDNGRRGGGDQGQRGGGERPAPAPAPAPAPVAAAPAAVAPPVAVRNAREGNDFAARAQRDGGNNARQQGGYSPRPGTPEWRAQQGVGTPPSPQAQQQRQQQQQQQHNWANDQGRSNSNGQRGDDHRGDNGRPNGARPDGGRPDNGRPDNGRPDNGRPGNNDNHNWNNGNNRNNWHYTPGARVQNRWNGTRPWTNDWRRDRRYDWQDYRRDHRDVYRLPRYSAPYGWRYGYSRFAIGIYLNSLLFSQGYWIDDPYDYRLPPAYGTLRWVRYYNDALLVDIRDGYVVDVVYDVFW